MLSFSYVHISVHLVSTELVFPDKCFVIFLYHLNLYFLVFTGFFFILSAFSTLKSAMRPMQFVPITYLKMFQFFYIFVNRMKYRGKNCESFSFRWRCDEVERPVPS